MLLGGLFNGAVNACEVRKHREICYKCKMIPIDCC